MSAEVKRYWARVHDLGCALTRGTPVVHHILGRELTAIVGDVKGVSLKNSDWLVIPLQPLYHNGALGIHTLGVETWEKRYGSQIYTHLRWVIGELGVDVFAKSGLVRPW